MKSLVLVLLMSVGLWAHAGGMALMMQGKLVKKTKSHVIFETETLRYKIRLPKYKSKNQPFELKHISGSLYTLNADVSLIVSKTYVKR